MNNPRTFNVRIFNECQKRRITRTNTQLRRARSCNGEVRAVGKAGENVGRPLLSASKLRVCFVEDLPLAP